MVSFDCEFSDPLTWQGTAPDSNGDSWNFYKETCTYTSSTTGNVYAPSTDIQSPDDIAIYGSFTAGELVMSFLMFALIVIELGKIIANGLEKINTRRTFIRFKDSDTEITNDIT